MALHLRTCAKGTQTIHIIDSYNNLTAWHNLKKKTYCRIRPFTDTFIGAKCTVSSKGLWPRLLYMKDIIGYKGSNRLKKGWKWLIGIPKTLLFAEDLTRGMFQCQRRKTYIQSTSDHWSRLHKLGAITVSFTRQTWIHYRVSHYSAAGFLQCDSMSEKCIHHPD